jgi:signal transduction histidine kinase
LGKPGRTISRDLEVFYPENRYLNFYLAPIDGTEGDHQPLGYVMLVRDLTSTRAEAEETLESERLNALTLLAAGVAHEIGNPLNSLDIHLQLLGRKLRKLPPGDRGPLEENLTTARAEIQRLDLILKQFLHAVRPTAPLREKQDLHAILHETLRLLEPELASRKIAVQLDLADSLPPAFIDPGQFQQVFYNLIRNAFQAISSDHGHVTIRTRMNDFETIISIEDNGTGISPEHMGALFEPYRTTKSSGSGLGLLIVRRIIREHGGAIAIESEENQGTRVLINFPHKERPVRLLVAPEPDPVIDL